MGMQRLLHPGQGVRALGFRPVFGGACRVSNAEVLAIGRDELELLIFAQPVRQKIGQPVLVRWLVREIPERCRRVAVESDYPAANAYDLLRTRKATYLVEGVR